VAVSGVWGKPSGFGPVHSMDSAGAVPTKLDSVKRIGGHFTTGLAVSFCETASSPLYLTTNVPPRIPRGGGWYPTAPGQDGIPGTKTSAESRPAKTCITVQRLAANTVL
jgi:hypothetical protein